MVYSFNQTCTITQDSTNGNTNITSKVQLPCRNNYTGSCHEELDFITWIKFNNKDDKGNSYVTVVTDYVEKPGAPDFDFIETTFDSP